MSFHSKQKAGRKPFQSQITPTRLEELATTSQYQQDIDMTFEHLTKNLEPSAKAREYQIDLIPIIKEFLTIVQFLITHKFEEYEFEAIQRDINSELPSNSDYSTTVLFIFYLRLFTNYKAFNTNINFREAVLFHGNPFISYRKNLEYFNTIKTQFDGNTNGSINNKTLGYMIGWIISFMNNEDRATRIVRFMKRSIKKHSGIVFITRN